MTYPQMRNPGTEAGASWNVAGERQFHVDHASADALLQRLEAVQKAGNGWRARCPACGGKSRKVSIAEAEGRVLVHCFGGCAAGDVIAAVGLAWADLYPPRTWPPTRDERRRMSRAIQEAGWAAALDVLALESRVVHLAATEVVAARPIEWDDFVRLGQAADRIAGAAAVMLEGSRHGKA